jgi:hypothetical protein
VYARERGGPDGSLVLRALAAGEWRRLKLIGDAGK